MEAIYDFAPSDTVAADGERILLVMLPGARDVPRDFIKHGFIRALRERTLPIDVAAVDAHIGYYLEQSITERLAEDIVAPARARGYRHIWFLGISLGGMGSLLYSRKHPAAIEGVVLLAPYLGNRGLIAEVTKVGGLGQWRPGEIPIDDNEQALLAWLQQYQSGSPGAPKLWLGYGTGDRFAPASILLAERLPAAQMAAIPGGHDWPTWSALWQRLLDNGLFTGRQPSTPTDH